MILLTTDRGQRRLRSSAPLCGPPAAVLHRSIVERRSPMAQAT